jgi:hypothetical protein
LGGLLTGAGQTLGSNLVGGHKVRVKRGGGCYIATAVYGSYDCPQVWTLRRYRDSTLAESWLGRSFVRVYYTVSPTLVKWFGRKIWFNKFWHGVLDRKIKNLQKNGIKDSPYDDYVKEER